MAPQKKLANCRFAAIGEFFYVSRQDAFRESIEFRLVQSEPEA
jgi:hypothetical protein